MIAGCLYHRMQEARDDPFNRALHPRGVFDRPYPANTSNMRSPGCIQCKRPCDVLREANDDAIVRIVSGLGPEHGIQGAQTGFYAREPVQV